MQVVRRGFGSMGAALPLVALVFGGVQGCNCTDDIGDTAPEIRATPEAVVFGSDAPELFGADAHQGAAIGFKRNPNFRR